MDKAGANHKKANGLGNSQTKNEFFRSLAKKSSAFLQLSFPEFNLT